MRSTGTRVCGISIGGLRAAATRNSMIGNGMPTLVGDNPIRVLLNTLGPCSGWGVSKPRLTSFVRDATASCEKSTRTSARSPGDIITLVTRIGAPMNPPSDPISEKPRLSSNANR